MVVASSLRGRLNPFGPLRWISIRRRGDAADADLRRFALHTILLWALGATFPTCRGRVRRQTMPCSRVMGDASPRRTLPPSPELERRFFRGRSFEADVIRRLLELHFAAVMVEGESGLAREEVTAAS